MTASFCRMQSGENVTDFCAAMDRGTATFQFHQNRVFANGNMNSIKANVRGQIGVQIAKINAVIETRRDA